MMRLLSSLLLALVLALTSQSMAVARGASAATGQMVLCTGTGPVAVYVDAEGQPTSAPHICPDCALQGLVDVQTPAPTAPTILLRFERAWHVAPVDAPHRLRLAPPARAPPLMV